MKSEERLKHGITDEEWEDFLVGRSAPHTQARINAHMVGCVECWDLYQDESPAMRAIATAAAEAREMLTVSGERMHSALIAVLAGIRDEDSAKAEIRSGLAFLRSMLVPGFVPKEEARGMVRAASECAGRCI